MSAIRTSISSGMPIIKAALDGETSEGRERHMSGAELTCWSLHACRICQRHADVLCLSAINRVCRNGISKQFSFGTAASLSTDAIVALLTGRIEWHHHLVADREIFDVVALFENVANEFVTADKVCWAF